MNQPPHAVGKVWIDDERFAALMRDDTLHLTAEEIADGWHFCWEWDGLLVGPGMDEFDEFCQCRR